MHEFELVSVESGANSLRSMEFGQTFHPVTGPMTEAMALHVAQQRLVERASAFPDGFVIWDVGLGAAANAIAAINALAGCGRKIRIHSFDKAVASLEFALRHVPELGYLSGYEQLLHEFIRDGFATITDPASDTWIEWKLVTGDFCHGIAHAGFEPPHAIMYDPFSPSVNQEMWTLEHFCHLRKRVHSDVPCLLTTYSRSTAVRVTLLLAGFFVGEGCEIGPKEQTTVASNHPDLIHTPLDARWLGRVARSTNGAPLRGNLFSMGRISESDLEALKAHPQFSILQTNPVHSGEASIPASNTRKASPPGPETCVSSTPA